MPGLIAGGSVIESLSALGVLKSSTGRIFLVDPSDSGFTIQDAIDECIASNGDIILLLPGGQEVSTPVLFNKSGITVLAVNHGMSPLVSGESFSIFGDSALNADPAAIISAKCKIFGVGFVSQDAGSSFFEGAALLIGGAAAGAFGVHLKNCRFPKWGLANSIGVALAGGEAVTDVLIEGCTFEGVGTALAAGIYMQGAIENVVIRRNYFRQCTAAVKFWTFAGGGGPHCFIHENFVEDGLLLDSQGVNATGLIAGNWLETAHGASYDDARSTLVGQGLQFAGNHYAEA